MNEDVPVWVKRAPGPGGKRERNQEIWQRVLCGEQISVLAREYGIGPVRVRSILHQTCRRLDLWAYQAAQAESHRRMPKLSELRKHFAVFFNNRSPCFSKETTAMSEDIPEYATPPIKGYRILTEEDVVEINKLKELEAAVLSAVARLVERRSNDGRWISIGRTHIEEGFMALNRSIAKPDALPLFKIPPLSEASVA